MTGLFCVDANYRSHFVLRIILGGGLVKHHTCNANLMRNGADYSVYINTGQVCMTAVGIV
jgi:deoxyhypusine synthase